MTVNESRAALLIIDMERGFIDENSPCCIRGAAQTVESCAKVAACARERQIPVFHIKRIYRSNGSDVEITRYQTWKDTPGLMSPGSQGPLSAQSPACLRPQPGDYTILKPRWSAFFGTELDLILRRLHIETLILTGTTTPNCIRTTAYDANALDYHVVVLEDCTSSQTPDIQRANLEDMRRMGAIIQSAADFLQHGVPQATPSCAQLHQEIQGCRFPPEPLQAHALGYGWVDIW